MTIFISYTYNYSSKPSTIVTSFLNLGQFFLPRSTNLLFGLVGPELNPILESKPKLVLTIIKQPQHNWGYFRHFIDLRVFWSFFLGFRGILVIFQVLGVIWSFYSFWGGYFGHFQVSGLFSSIFRLQRYFSHFLGYRGIYIHSWCIFSFSNSSYSFLVQASIFLPTTMQACICLLVELNSFYVFVAFCLS